MSSSRTSWLYSPLHTVMIMMRAASHYFILRASIQERPVRYGLNFPVTSPPVPQLPALLTGHSSHTSAKFTTSLTLRSFPVQMPPNTTRLLIVIDRSQVSPAVWKLLVVAIAKTPAVDKSIDQSNDNFPPFLKILDRSLVGQGHCSHHRALFPWHVATSLLYMGEGGEELVGRDMMVDTV